MNIEHLIQPRHVELFTAACGTFIEKGTTTRIKVNGKYIRLRSGKSQWKNIGSAKNALINQLGANIIGRLCLEFTGDRYSSYRSKIRTDFINYLINVGVLEFVTE